MNLKQIVCKSDIMPILKYNCVFWVTLLLYLQNSEAIECPTKNDNKCESFWQQLSMYPGHNLREGLKCLNYNGNITSMQANGNTSSPQRIHIEVLSSDIIEVNEEKEFGVWRIKMEFTWQDERLKWPTECEREKEGIPDFVESELMNVLWNPVNVLFDISHAKNPSCQETIQIDKVNN